MAAKPRIVFVYDAIYPYSKGGGERRFYELGTRLVKQGYEVHWYGMRYWDNSHPTYNATDGTIDNSGIMLHGLCRARPLYIDGGRRSISQALIFGLSSIKLIGIKFDVIDCCGFPYFSLFPAKLAALFRRKPLYATWHEVWGRKYWDEYLGKLGVVGFIVESVASKLPTTIVAASQHTATQLTSTLGAKHVEVVANGIDTKALAAIKPASQKSDLVYAGRLMDFKNVHLIIEALDLLKQRKQTLSLAVVGDGPALKDLRALAIKLGVDRQITWHGFLPNAQDVYRHIKAAKVFVLPSKREGFGIVAIEANACGVPVLTADYSDNAAKDLINPGVNGYVFEPMAAALADAIEQSLTHQPMLKAGSLQSVALYNWDALALQLAKSYKV